MEPGESDSVMKAPEKLDFQGFWARRKSRILDIPQNLEIQDLESDSLEGDIDT